MWRAEDQETSLQPCGHRDPNFLLPVVDEAIFCQFVEVAEFLPVRAAEFLYKDPSFVK